MKSLAAFCIESDGKYELYLAGVLLSRESDDYEGDGHHSELEDDEDDYANVTLKAPWLKYGSTTPATYPWVEVREDRDVAPLGRANDVTMYIEVYDMDLSDYDIIEKIHENFRQTGVANAFALVVRPVSMDA